MPTGKLFAQRMKCIYTNATPWHLLCKDYSTFNKHTRLFYEYHSLPVLRAVGCTHDVKRKSCIMCFLNHASLFYMYSVYFFPCCMNVLQFRFCIWSYVLNSSRFHVHVTASSFLFFWHVVTFLVVVELSCLTCAFGSCTSLLHFFLTYPKPPMFA